MAAIVGNNPWQRGGIPLSLPLSKGYIKNVFDPNACVEASIEDPSARRAGQGVFPVWIRAI
jgi:hypothetical protein